MKIVKQGEAVTRSTTVDTEEMTVTKHHVTKHKDGTLYEVEWMFDYSECTQAQILEMASRDSVIKARPEFKKAPQSELHLWESKIFDVAAILKRERTTQTPFQKVIGNVPLLSKTDRDALKEQLEALDIADAHAEIDAEAS